MSMAGEFSLAQQAAVSSQPSLKLDCKWKLSPHGVIKVNYDAATFLNDGVFLGVVMRGDVGDVVTSTCLPLHGRFDADIAEAIAMRHALSIVIESGFRNVCMETDCLKLHSHLIKRNTLATTFGSIINDIIHLARSCQSCYFSFVKREGNQVSHALAKLCSSFVSFRVWIEEVPSHIAEIVMADRRSLLID
ncbi:uncharacterized protein LOC110713793 [Chenopodium quinoa]|uniref:uncharacterized protein LOC110713793 n=1 Tax=Chenopodium quinoa TaxID=63459 RepID=UPI000B797219|nr:uncharacterized protein LOC110713793 [Chenopodium quinoa]